jgi:hypothetical protein
MAACMKWLALACVAWILFMDETVYTLADNSHRPQDPIAAEGAKSQFRQLAVLPTKAACDTLLKQKAQQAEAAQAQQAQQAAQAQKGTQPKQKPVYPDRNRFLCAPAE